MLPCRANGQACTQYSRVSSANNTPSVVSRTVPGVLCVYFDNCEFPLVDPDTITGTSVEKGEGGICSSPDFSKFRYNIERSSKLFINNFKY